MLPPPAESLDAISADFDADGALSRAFLLRRGRCCNEGCRNCPYGFDPLEGRPPCRPSL